MTIQIDPIISILMDFYADCYGKHEKTELINYREWADKIYKVMGKEQE